MISSRTFRLSVALLLVGLTAASGFARDSDQDRGRDHEPNPFFILRPDVYGDRNAQVKAEERAASKNFFVLLGQDFKNLVTTKESLVVLGVGLGASFGASHADTGVATSSLNSELSGAVGLDRLFEPGEIAGAGHAQLGIAAATYGLGKLFSSDGVTVLGRDLLRAQIVAGTVTFAIKKAVGRERPDGSSTTSFPSGHTSAAFATASVLGRHYGWRAGVPAYVFAAYVAGSRLNEARHYLSDVVFGAAIGIAAGRTVTLDLASQRFALGPAFGPDGGVGVQLTWVGPSSRP